MSDTVRRPALAPEGGQPESAQPVRGISLDIWGTLVGSDPAFKPARNEMLRRALAPSVAADRFDATLRAADRDADEICMTRGRDVGFTERLDLALARLGAGAVIPEQVDDLMAAQADLARTHHPRPLHPDLPGLVAAAAAAKAVVLTSNTGMLPGSLMRELLALAGFPAGLGEVFSNETGWAKPAPQIFACTIEMARNLDETCEGARFVIHLGDNPVADVDGATAAGLRALLVAPDGEGTAAALRQLL
ncbi:HAD family hydrolase [Calidifontibacter sp. DB0510]|uniref:HAD family hydrolase n=1 Tax=Metallococcus carri TaxID=1656884 RepID=A0A967EAG7_9MICO|nr:HAD family hydrolase [Metallococcus carri]NHN56250.1 HAD family hydrolase [Metallococcus carri]NOP38698.1 HAD family hydrolase [Calidifontibacter sp. DB2511S]